VTRVLALAFLLTTTLATAQSPDLVLQQVTVIDMTGAPARKGVDVLIHSAHNVPTIDPFCVSGEVA